jgi:hypothetical protein
MGQLRFNICFLTQAKLGRFLGGGGGGLNQPNRADSTPAASFYGIEFPAANSSR